MGFGRGGLLDRDRIWVDHRQKGYLALALVFGSYGVDTIQISGVVVLLHFVIADV